MRFSDAGLRCRQTKLIYPNHRLPPWLTEDEARVRSNRLLEPRITTRHQGVPPDSDELPRVTCVQRRTVLVDLVPSPEEYELKHQIGRAHV